MRASHTTRASPHAATSPRDLLYIQAVVPTLGFVTPVSPRAEYRRGAPAQQCVVNAIGQPDCPDWPIDPSLPAGEIAAARGRAHLCGLGGDHVLSCWGDDAKGQAPARVEGVVLVAAAADYTCVIDVHAAVSCFGASPGPVPSPATHLPPDIPADAYADHVQCRQSYHTIDCHEP